MDIQLESWASLIFRWAHIVAGIGWIGASFYFMALDYALKRREGMDERVKGENWQVHGGGFYHIQKYMVAPEQMPNDLKWFQWDSYATWLTGFALMAVLYYWQADIYLIDRSVLALSKPQAILISVATLTASWLIYDGLCRSPLRHNSPAMFACLFVLLIAAAWGLGQVFSPRAAFLHVGAMIGTIMTGNVFFIIIPNQRIVVQDLKAGRIPDAKFGIIAKLRSTHNNYLTLPVLFLMISNHYPMTFGHPMAWAVIAFILPIGAIIRDYFNAHDRGEHGKRLAWQWPSAALLLLALMIFVSWRPAPTPTIASTTKNEIKTKPSEKTSTTSALENAALKVVQARCSVCHSANPTDFVDAPPSGVLLETSAHMRQYASKIHQQTIAANIMPPGNLTDMTQEERAILASWLESIGNK